MFIKHAYPQKVHKEKLFPFHLVKHFYSQQWTTYNWKQNQNPPLPQVSIPRGKKKVPYQEKKKWEEKQRKNHISKAKSKKEIK